jgi:multiple sugar transport system substrate-binding protein
MRRSAISRRPAPRDPRRWLWRLAAGLVLLALSGCDDAVPPQHPPLPEVPLLRWYVFAEPSGAFAAAAQRCSETSAGSFRVELVPLPADADQQREQLVRRLAARDSDIDIIGMDVIWIPEFAAAGWILPWSGRLAEQSRAGRLDAAVQSADFDGRLWAAPFTTNTQLLWYRTDRIETPPATWQQMLAMATPLGAGAIQAQGERYEGLTVLFTSLLASAGGAVLDASGTRVALPDGPTRTALGIMRRLASFPAADTSLATDREDQARLAFETGAPTFMLNYTYVWPSAQRNAPQVAANMGWARWPAVVEGRPSRVTIGGINLGVGAWSRHPQLAFRAAACIASEDNQRLAAQRGGLPPTIAALYDDPQVRKTFPFADLLRATLQDAVQRARTPLYNDVSLAISRTLHPMRDIDPQRDVARLRAVLDRALRSEGLL